SLGFAFRKLQSVGLYTKTEHRTLRGIYKKNRRNGTLFGFFVSTEIKVLMGITA
ncbi:MAG: IS6 family transposase, partial [Streptococcus thermophilus]